jgi:hypothetical protein
MPETPGTPQAGDLKDPASQEPTNPTAQDDLNRLNPEEMNESLRAERALQSDSAAIE